MTKHTCNTCRYFHQLKEFKDGAWVYGTVCTLFPQNEQGFDAFALVVSRKDKCEMWDNNECMKWEGKE